MNDTDSTMVRKVRTGLVQVSDIRMGYRIFGKGYPLILITGFGSTMVLWERRLIRRLTEHFQVIIFDHRGAGRSDVGEKSFTLERFADDTAGLMNALGVPSAHILGWSMGGLIAEELALKYPDKVDRLILYAAHCSGDLHPPTREVIEQICRGSGLPDFQDSLKFVCMLFPDDWVEKNQHRIRGLFLKPMSTIPVEELRKQAQAIENWNGVCERLRGVMCPTLLVHGDSDILTPLEESKNMARLIPDSRLEIMKGGGHGVIFQERERFADIVLDFLKDQESRLRRQLLSFKGLIQTTLPP